MDPITLAILACLSAAAAVGLIAETLPFIIQFMERNDAYRD